MGWRVFEPVNGLPSPPLAMRVGPPKAGVCAVVRSFVRPYVAVYAAVVVVVLLQLARSVRRFPALRLYLGQLWRRFLRFRGRFRLSPSDLTCRQFPVADFGVVALLAASGLQHSSLPVARRPWLIIAVVVRLRDRKLITPFSVHQ